MKCNFKSVSEVGSLGRVVIPTEAVVAAKFNTGLPVYIVEMGQNHLVLTQNGSHPGIELGGRGRHRSVLYGEYASNCVGREYRVTVNNRCEDGVREFLIRSTEDNEIMMDAIAV